MLYSCGEMKTSTKIISIVSLITVTAILLWADSQRPVQRVGYYVPIEAVPSEHHFNVLPRGTYEVIRRFSDKNVTALQSKDGRIFPTTQVPKDLQKARRFEIVRNPSWNYQFRDEPYDYETTQGGR